MRPDPSRVTLVVPKLLDSLTLTQKTESLTGKLKPESVSGVSLRTSTPRHVRAGHGCRSPPSCLVRQNLVGSDVTYRRRVCQD